MQMLHFWHATRRGTRAPRRPHRTVLVLLALVAALGIGAQVFLWLCWPHGQFALEAEDGSLAALEGFTVQGGKVRQRGHRSRFYAQRWCADERSGPQAAGRPRSPQFYEQCAACCAGRGLCRPQRRG